MASRKQKQLEIQPLPRRLYKQVYGRDYEDDWQLRFSGLSESEKRAVNALLEQHSFKNIYWIPEIDFPRGHKTPDLLIDGKRVEIKEVSNSRSLEKQVSKAYKQVGADGMVIIDTTKSKLTAGEAVRTAELRCGQRNIVRFAIVNNNRLLAYKVISNKKDGSSSAAYAGHEMKPSYIDILPQTAKKSISHTNNDNVSAISNFKPRKHTNAYWQKRSEQRLTESEQTSESYAKQVRKVYQEAQRQTVLEVRKMYEAYYKKDEGFDMQALRSIAPSGDIKRFQAQMREAGLSTYLPDNYKGRMTRLELLNAQMWGEVKKAATKHDAIETVAHKKVYDDTYYRTAYDVSKGIGGTPSSFSTLDTKTVDRVLNVKFQGKNFSERIWGNTDILAKQLKEKLAVAIATGQSLDKTSRDIRERFGVSKYYADRLIRTESNYFHNLATVDSYKAMGIEQYQFLATLDMRTSEVCQHMDGKVFKVKDAKSGDSVPPLHPNCRSTVVPYLKGYQPATRIYRDPDTGKNKYTYNVSYKEWKDLINRPSPENSSKTEKQVKTTAKAALEVAKVIRNSTTNTNKNDKKITADNFNSSFTKTAADRKNTELFAEYLNNNKDNADKNVFDMYANMGELYDGDIQVSHSGTSKFSTLTRDGRTISGYKIVTPKISDSDDIASIGTTLHEYGHYIDKFAKGSSNIDRASTSSNKLLDIIKNDNGVIGKDVQSLFDKHMKGVKLIENELWDEAQKQAQSASLEYKSGEMNWKQYSRKLSSIKQNYKKTYHQRARSFDGGGIDALEDIYDALSSGKLFSSKKIMSGHGSTYYWKVDNRAKEIFANYSQIAIMRPDLLKLLRKEKPELTEELDKVIASIVNEKGIIKNNE